MQRRVLLPLLCLACATPAVAGAAAKTSWAQPQIKLVTSRGLMGGNLQTFQPDAPLTQGALADLAAGLAEQTPAAVAIPSAPATMTQLDASLVRSLGLRRAAAAFSRGARAAGLAPPSRFGNETVARLLGLRTNHPVGQDSLELLPGDTATRAEAAFSAAWILTLGGRESDGVSDAALEFELTPLTKWERAVLHTAVSLIGYPYVWGGTSEKPQTALGTKTPGGFDCSGFVWRVYKLQQYAGAPALATAIRGRTTMQMSGEVPKAQRIPMEALEPADVLFFGTRGPKSQPSQVDHAALYLGNGWLIQSSAYGVALAKLEGWYATRFAWARRPLAEARLG